MDYLPLEKYETRVVSRFHSQVLANAKIREIIKQPISSQETINKFRRARIKIKGFLMWLKVLQEVREYGTNSQLFDSYGKYRSTIFKVFKPVAKQPPSKTEKFVEFNYLVNPESLFCQIWNIIVLLMLLI